MIKSFVFDWGGVLIEEPSIRMYTYCAKALQVSLREFQLVYERCSQDFQRGAISEDMLWDAICLELKCTKPTVPSLWEAAFRDAYVEKKEIFDLASTLHSDGYCIGLLSNTEAPALRFFHEQQYLMFDVTVFSCAEGTRKPEERIYQILLRRLQVQPEEVIFIDDKEEYIKGAEKRGITTILFKNHTQLRDALSSFL
jgi:putative hydrolase of the HAD superfamily